MRASVIVLCAVGHIFISYNWSSQPTVLKIRDRLRKAGFEIWIDIENTRTNRSFLLPVVCLSVCPTSDLEN